MLWADVRLGAPFDASPFARVRLGGAPEPAAVVAPAAVIQGVAYVPVPGPPGLPGAAAGSYTHTQTTPAAVWTVAHNLGYIPSVQARTTGGAIFDAEIIHLSSNVLELHLAVPFTGSARLI